jgi:DNA-binding NarL/FixJ family response regulator
LRIESPVRFRHCRIVLKILVIEDHAPMRRNLVKLLQLENFEVVAAQNGRLGLEVARTEKPDLVICDIMMPGVNGYSVLQALRDAPETATIPFIFLTAREEKFDQRGGMNLGADDYLTKPVEREDLLSAIRARLKRKRAHDEQTQAQVANVQVKPDFSSAVPLERLGLTAREAEVLLWVAQGKANAEIAIILGMAEKTVKTHLGSVFVTLGVESRTAASLRAAEVLYASGSLSRA